MSNIVYVEDNPDNFRLVKTLLERAGHRVTGATDGMEAVAVVVREKPDLVLMDINIPNLGGYEVTTQLKSVEGLESLPVVALTAKTMKVDKDMALAAGCAGFIPKPLDPFKFVSEVESYLRGRKETIDTGNARDALKEYSRQLVSALQEKVGQLQETNRRLLESEERYRTLVENIHVGIWFLSEKRQTLFLNRPMRDLLGIGNIDPLSPDPFLAGDAGAAFHEHLDKCADDRFQLWESPLATGKNDDRRVVISAAAVDDNGKKLSGYLLSFLDITEKHRMERHIEQVHRLESLSVLTSGVAHDFNNILGGILNCSELLMRRTDLSEEVKKWVGAILEAAERGSNFTSQLLAFSRKAPSHPKRLDPAELLAKFCAFFEKYKHPRIRLVRPGAGRCPDIMADPVQMDQMMLNLATNAQDAMPEGGTLSFGIGPSTVAPPGTGPEAAGSQFVCFTVRDTGMGMSEENRQHVFEPFFTTKSPGKGTGLGLSAVFGIVKVHGGHIEVDSELGRGTEFRVYIPCADEDVSGIQAVSAE